MPHNFNNPVTVESVIGPKDITPGQSLSVVYRMALIENDADKRTDIAALALLYAAHLSSEHTAFDVERRSLRVLERQGYLRYDETGPNSASVRLLPIIP